MLIRFEVENFRSIREPVELSMVAIDDGRAQARSIDSLKVSLLPVVGIFGPNASGKSNVLEAYRWLQRAVQGSLRDWNQEIPVEQFASDQARSQDSSFCVELVVGGIRHEYLLDVGRDAVSYEALFHYPEGRRRRVFEREGDQMKLQAGLGSLSGVRELLNSRTLALSAMRKFNEPITRSFINELLPLSGQAIDMSLRGSAESSLTAYLLKSKQDEDGPGLEADRARVLSLLQLADLGVCDLDIQDSEEGTGFPAVRLVHDLGGVATPFAFAQESQGTKAWYALIGPLMVALKAGSLFLFDELDASLHPTLTVELLRLFGDPKSNPLGAQLVFTSHDTNLLNHLNRDEIWLTEKRRDGSTRLAALSDFVGKRVRTSSNLERGYLSGRFGALPDVSKPDVLRELGLIG